MQAAELQPLTAGSPPQVLATLSTACTGAVASVPDHTYQHCLDLGTSCQAQLQLTHPQTHSLAAAYLIEGQLHRHYRVGIQPSTLMPVVQAPWQLARSRKQVMTSLLSHSSNARNMLPNYHRINGEARRLVFVQLTYALRGAQQYDAKLMTATSRQRSS